MVRLGISPDIFWSSTYRQLSYAIEENNKQIEFAEQQQWERTRWLAFVLLQPHIKKNSIRSPRDIAQFPWEEVHHSGNPHIPREQIFSESENKIIEKLKRIPLIRHN
jgi:hypothetical protein